LKISWSHNEIVCKTDLQQERELTAQQRAPHIKHIAGLSGTVLQRGQRSFKYLHQKLSRHSVLTKNKQTKIF